MSTSSNKITLNDVIHMLARFHDHVVVNMDEDKSTMIISPLLMGM